MLWRLVVQAWDWSLLHNCCPCLWGGHLGTRFCVWMEHKVYWP